MYRAWFLTVSTVFILVGVIVRVHGVDDPILGFHPTRQYRSAIIARSCYYDHLDGVSPADTIVQVGPNASMAGAMTSSNAAR